MSELDDARQEMAAEILDVLGVDCVYTFKDISTKAIKVRITENVEVIDDESGLQMIDRVVGIDPVDIPNPLRGETFLIDGKTHTIGRDLGQKGGLNRYQVT